MPCHPSGWYVRFENLPKRAVRTNITFYTLIHELSERRKEKGSPHGVVGRVLDVDFVVSEFEKPSEVDMLSPPQKKTKTNKKPKKTNKLPTYLNKKKSVEAHRDMQQWN